MNATPPLWRQGVDLIERLVWLGSPELVAEGEAVSLVQFTLQVHPNDLVARVASREVRVDHRGMYTEARPVGSLAGGRLRVEAAADIAPGALGLRIITNGAARGAGKEDDDA